MAKLTPEGEKIVAALADRYAVGVDAVKMMLDAVAKGGGSMAQFNVPEFGGSGQWMRGGMTMIGDMFNNSMKATVDNLCNDLSKALENQPNIMTVFVPQSQSQSQSQGSGGTSFWQSSQSGSWWPSELGSPASTGSQNSLRYAYFPGGNRLAIDDRGRVEVYDTSGYDIGGFGQQQSGDASLTFTSQRGVVRVDRLPRVTGAKPAPETRPATAAQSTSPSSSADTSCPAPAAQSTSPSSSTDTGSVLALIEQLGQLKEKGLLTDEEFAAKKGELLKRL